MANTKSQAGYTDQVRTKIRNVLDANIQASFSSTLGQVNDIVNICVSQVYKESSFNYDAIGIYVSSGKGTTGYKYLQSSPVQALLSNPDTPPLTRAYIYQGLRGLGVGQVMGWNFVRGGGPTGKCEIEYRRPDLAGVLCVPAGTDLVGHVLGESNLSKAVLAQLVLLEAKYNATSQGNGGFVVNGDPYKRVFPSKIEAAVAAYLGLGRQDGNGTTPQAYAASIVQGTAYAIANGNSAVAQQRQVQVAQADPGTNGSDYGRVTPPGC